MERGQCDVPCEPEQAGEGVEGEDGPFVEEAAVGLGAAGEDGVEEEVGECEEGEGCGGDEVGGGGGGGGGVGVVEVPGCYCGGEVVRFWGIAGARGGCCSYRSRLSRGR